jgi:NADP-reducing hydrogenase subunit HndD
VGVKETSIPGVGKGAVCNGIAAAQRILATATWREQYVAIEVMACVGGCLGGGGEPKSMAPPRCRKNAYGRSTRSTVARSTAVRMKIRIYKRCI